MAFSFLNHNNTGIPGIYAGRVDVEPVPLLLCSHSSILLFLDFKPVSAAGLGIRIGRIVECSGDAIQ